MPPFIFFGTSEFSVIALETLRGRGILPLAIVTTPDRPQGRKLIITEPPTKVWAKEHSIGVFQFEKLDADAVSTLTKIKADLFIVASYGKIIPQSILDIPRFGCLNIHPSLLPKYRGASPLQTTIISDDHETGVTIIKMDAGMDHGPIVTSKKVSFENWPPTFGDMEKQLAITGAEILADSIPAYISGSLEPTEQKHEEATFTKKIMKEDGLIDPFSADPQTLRLAYLKIHAFEGWPGAYFFTERKGTKIRVVAKEAKYESGVDGSPDTLTLTRVVPEGGKEMAYEDFQKGL